MTRWRSGRVPTLAAAGVLLVVMAIGLGKTATEPEHPGAGPIPDRPRHGASSLPDDLDRPSPPRRFVAEVADDWFGRLGVPDGWTAVATVLYATSFGTSERPGIDVSDAGVRIDTGRYRFDLAWEDLGAAYTIDGGPMARERVVCLITQDSRPLCMRNMRFAAPEEVAAGLNRALGESPPWRRP